MRSPHVSPTYRWSSTRSDPQSKNSGHNPPAVAWLIKLFLHRESCHCQPEDGGRMVLRNICIVFHRHKNLKSRNGKDKIKLSCA